MRPPARSPPARCTSPARPCAGRATVLPAARRSSYGRLRRGIAGGTKAGGPCSAARVAWAAPPRGGGLVVELATEAEIVGDPLHVAALVGDHEAHAGPRRTRPAGTADA